jgi:hypothetical protein
MPASKVRKKAKNKIASDRKRTRELDSRCADTCCGPEVAVRTPLPAPVVAKGAPDRQ